MQAAIATGEAALLRDPPDPALTLFVGVLCCREGKLNRGIEHLRAAVALAPGEATAKIELARALTSIGANAEAEAVASPLASLSSGVGREMTRIRAHALLRQAQPDEAAACFEQLVALDPADFESWDGLGASRLALGQVEAAVAASSIATQRRPTAIAYWINLSRALLADQNLRGAIDAAREAVTRGPADAAAQLELARALARSDEIDAALEALSIASELAKNAPELLSEIADVEFTCKTFDRAEATYREALRLRPDMTQAWTGLAKLLERNNRIAELLEALDAAQAVGVSEAASALLRARALRATGDLNEALQHALLAPATVDGVARAQLIGDISDRLGDVDGAFAAFSEANALLAEAAVDSREMAEEYRRKFERLTSLVTPEWFASWTDSPIGARRAPLFIFGFPRSGTTLIDTMLSGHPDTVVLEEEPTIDHLAAAMGSPERIPGLTPGEIEALREGYFAEVDRIAPHDAGKLIVDKNPLGLSAMPLIHRIFPDARIVFAERHPCDVVLSCFITSANMDVKVANFFDFEDTARLYHEVLTFWHQCREVLPLDLHAVRYERLIADTESELRGVAAFAGLDWNANLLENRSSAAARAYIGSPSYAQVAEPIYTRARGRWLKYRAHMTRAIAILDPWIRRLGYEPPNDPEPA